METEPDRNSHRYTGNFAIGANAVRFVDFAIEFANCFRLVRWIFEEEGRKTKTQARKPGKLFRRLHSRKSALLFRLLRGELARISQRIDGIDVFIRSHGFDPRKTQRESTRMACARLN